MREKKSFVMYRSWEPMIDALSDEELASLIRIIFKFQNTGELPPDIEPAIRPVLALMVSQFEKDNAAYKEKCAKNKEIIRQRWNKEKPTNENETTVTNTDEYERIRTNTDEYERIPDRDRDRDRDRDNISLPNGRETTRACAREASPALKPKKISFGKEFGHVKLTQDEHDRLVEKYPALAEDLIDEMDLYLDNHPGKYKKHYSALLQWARKRVSEGGDKRDDDRRTKGQKGEYYDTCPEEPAEASAIYIGGVQVLPSGNEDPRDRRT